MRPKTGTPPGRRVQITLRRERDGFCRGWSFRLVWVVCWDMPWRDTMQDSRMAEVHLMPAKNSE